MVTASPPLTSLESLLQQVAIELQLPPYLDDEVRTHYRALAQFIADSVLDTLAPSLYAQGSFRIGTIVKPAGSEEFDLDFVCELQSQTSDAARLFDAVAGAIESSALYGPKSKRLQRCIRITFSANCHVDIVPAIPDMSVGGTAIRIPTFDGASWSWRATDPKGYGRWFDNIGRTTTALSKAQTVVQPLPPLQDADDKSPLQVAVQLIKRNHQIVVTDPHLRTASIVHTTIAGNSGAGRSRSMVEAFDALVSATDDYAQRPRHVAHPTHPDEVVSEKWEEASILKAYRDYAATLTQQWRAVQAAKGQGYAVIMPLLNEMFGEAPVSKALKSLTDQAKSLSDNRAIKTIAGGALTSVVAGTGNPTKTFYGDDAKG